MSTTRLRESVQVLDATGEATLFDAVSGSAYRLVFADALDASWLAALRAGTLQDDDAARGAAVLDALGHGGFLEGGTASAAPRERIGHVLAAGEIAGPFAARRLRRLQRVTIAAADAGEQETVASALRVAFDDPSASELRFAEVDVGDRPVGDALLAVAEQHPVRLLLHGDRSDRPALRAGTADLCEVVLVEERDRTSTARLDEIVAMATEGRPVALRLRMGAPSDDAGGERAEQEWRDTFVALRKRVVDVELLGGARPENMALWQNSDLLPWTRAARRAWDLEQLTRIARWERATKNPIDVEHWKRLYADFAALVGPHLRLGRDGRLADLCGAMGFASTTLQGAGFVGPYRATVFDLDEVAAAKGRPLRQGSVQFRIADALRLPTGSSTFDAAIVVGAIDYFARDEARLRSFLAECRRILRPGSTLAIVHPLFWITSAAQLFVNVNYPDLVGLLTPCLAAEGFVLETRLTHGRFLSGRDALAMNLHHLPTNQPQPTGYDHDEVPNILHFVARRASS